ncbi:hypothetical protein BaRGS_00040232, partial [Batillaria attramentaria]
KIVSLSERECPQNVRIGAAPGGKQTPAILTDACGRRTAGDPTDVLQLGPVLSGTGLPNYYAALQGEVQTKMAHSVIRLLTSTIAVVILFSSCS